MINKCLYNEIEGKKGKKGGGETEERVGTGHRRERKRGGKGEGRGRYSHYA
jgi:hypothetical protein